MPTIRPTTTTLCGSCVAESEIDRKTDASNPVDRAFGLRALYRAYRRCRVGKRSAHNTQRFEARLLDRLIDTEDALARHTWRPSRTLAFVVSQPKAREVHAADFSDRVVHHVLVDQLAQRYEPVFIHDSYANRVGKGTHAAVDRLQSFLRSASGNGTHAAFTLQLDIANFFNSIHRPTLYRLLLARLTRDVRQQRIDAGVARALAAHCRALLSADPVADVHQRGSRARFASVPPHKRLGARGPLHGLLIGNLTSQFFANVYLNELDQFVKHTLKAKHYLRYVDDFVLVAPDAARLVAWRDAIIDFLRDRLQLSLRSVATPQPASNGVDFLGYVVRHSHRLVRRRVLNNCKAALRDFEAAHVLRRAHGDLLCLTAAAARRLHALMASYRAHFSHAQAHRLWVHLWRRFASLAAVYDECLPLRTALRPAWWASSSGSLAGDWRYFAQRFPGHILLVQVGCRYLISAAHSASLRSALSSFAVACPTRRTAFPGGVELSAHHARQLYRRFVRVARLNAAARRSVGTDGPMQTSCTAAGMLIVREFAHAADGRARRMLATLFSISSAPDSTWPHAAGRAIPHSLCGTTVVAHAT